MTGAPALDMACTVGTGMVHTYSAAKIPVDRCSRGEESLEYTFAGKRMGRDGARAGERRRGDGQWPPLRENETCVSRRAAGRDPGVTGDAQRGRCRSADGRLSRRCHGGSHRAAESSENLACLDRFTPLHEIPLYSFVSIPACHKTPPSSAAYKTVHFSSLSASSSSPSSSPFTTAAPAMYEEVCLLCSRPITVEGCVPALLMSVAHQTLTRFYYVTSADGHTVAMSARASTLLRPPSRQRPVRTPRRTSAQTTAQAVSRMSRP